MNSTKSKRYLVTTFTLVIFMTSTGMPLPARERRGSTVVVTMTDGSRVSGELLAVRDDVLLVYDHDARLGKSLDLLQVIQVMVHRRSKFLDGITIGICAGLAVSIHNLNKIDRESLVPPVEIVRSFLPLPVVAFGGGLLGALFSIPKKISLSGASTRNARHKIEGLTRFAREVDLTR